MKEYIVPIGDDALAYDEIFIGVLRTHKELIRCKDCQYSIDEYGDDDCYCRTGKEPLRYIGDWNHYCGWAKKRS